MTAVGRDRVATKAPQIRRQSRHLKAQCTRIVLLAATAFVAASPASAQENRIEALERQLIDQQQRIRQLENLITEQAALLKEIRATQTAQFAVAAPLLTAPAPVQAATAAATAKSTAHVPGLDVSGDLRVRQEWNLRDGRNRSRSVLRARARASYAAAPGLTIGAQIATGDPDDPNSTDVTLGNFLDDLSVSLDQAWVRYNDGGFTAWAGKFPQLVQRTDMVWDGDVSPQGAGAIYAVDLGGGAKLDVRGIYFVIDEAATARDSDMLGGQIVATGPLTSALKLTMAGSYYHYRLGSVSGADTGDFRSNLIVGGRYFSDFQLFNGIAMLAWAGPSARWPVVFTADYVKNAGAAVTADTGFNLELTAGRTALRGDWRIAYNYSEVGVDAVFAAFSHDNLDLATNYKLHGFGVGYVPAAGTLIDLAYYHYRLLDPLYAGIASPKHWIDRVRLNFMVSF